MNQNTISGKWKELKGEIRNQWGKLTDDEIESTKGNLTAVTGLIQQRYGEAKESTSEKLNSLFARYGAKSEKLAEDSKEYMANKSEDVKEALRDSKKP